jgi:hypothetical protein
MMSIMYLLKGSAAQQRIALTRQLYQPNPFREFTSIQRLIVDPIT